MLAASVAGLSKVAAPSSCISMSSVWLNPVASLKAEKSRSVKSRKFANSSS